MVYEWDDAKSDWTLRERGFGFDFAIGIFSGDIIETIDDRFEYGELRIKATGQTSGFIITLVYTDREGARRIISARIANAKERKQWLGLP